MSEDPFLELLKRRFYGFLPVHVFDPSPGCFIQFFRNKADPSTFRRADDLFYMRARLCLRLARSLAGGDSPTTLGRMAERPGVPFESARRRWAQFIKCLKSHSLSGRQNGIYKACVRDISGRNASVDFLMDDTCFIWQLASERNYSFGELEARRARLEQGFMPLPDVIEMDIMGGMWEYVSFEEAVRRVPRGAQLSWKFVSALFFCLCRAQARGDVLDYSCAYSLMAIEMNRTRVEIDSCIGQPSLEILIRRDFWSEFGVFWADWYSRIRLYGNSHQDLQDVITLLHRMQVSTTWQTIEPDRPKKQITGLFIEPSDTRAQKLLRSIKRPPCKLSKFGNILHATRYVKRNPVLLKDSWPSLDGGIRSWRFGKSQPVRFDGYIRRQRSPRRQEQSISKVNVRRIAEQHRRGPRSDSRKRVHKRNASSRRLRIRRFARVRYSLQRYCRPTFKKHVSFACSRRRRQGGIRHCRHLKMINKCTYRVTSSVGSD